MVGGALGNEGETQNKTEAGESSHRLVLLVAALIIFHIGALVSSSFAKYWMHGELPYYLHTNGSLNLVHIPQGNMFNP